MLQSNSMSGIPVRCVADVVTGYTYPRVAMEAWGFLCSRNVETLVFVMCWLEFRHLARTHLGPPSDIKALNMNNWPVEEGTVVGSGGSRRCRRMQEEDTTDMICACTGGNY